MKDEYRPQKLVIRESEWLSGDKIDNVRDDPEGHGASLLYRPQDRLSCCVGIYLNACGMPKKILSDMASASELEENGFLLPKRAGWLLRRGMAASIYISNDAKTVTRAHRKARIKMLFKEFGNVIVTFKP